MHKANFVIITGLSGAGKSQAVKVFEDMGYFCIDNLPAPLIPKFAELCSQANEKVSTAGAMGRIVSICLIKATQLADTISSASAS